MRIPESKIAEIAGAADIVQVISSYIELKKAGKDYRRNLSLSRRQGSFFVCFPSKEYFSLLWLRSRRERFQFCNEDRKSLFR